MIAKAWAEGGGVGRGEGVARAVQQAVLALGVPIRIGIAFVARTQTFGWSIQHSLCNVECAVLLCEFSLSFSPFPISPFFLGGGGRRRGNSLLGWVIRWKNKG